MFYLFRKPQQPPKNPKRRIITVAIANVTNIKGISSTLGPTTMIGVVVVVVMVLVVEDDNPMDFKLVGSHV